ncbi:hypothetical protein [Streptomyces sp. x-19]|uniref:hypothetical protein n=1 Tax=Streptomyces sp. x-19 TaxID=2789280 RepID=UPI00397F9B05
MGEAGDERDDRTVRHRTRNDVSGNVTGSVGQFGTVYGDVTVGGQPPESPEDATWRARYRERLSRQWDAEDAARAEAERRAEAVRRAQEEAPAIRWRNEDLAWRRRVAVRRAWAIALLVPGVAGYVAFALSGPASGYRGISAVVGMALFPGLACLVAYLLATVRYQLWRGW